METPDFFGGGYFNATSANSFSPEKRIAADQKLGENFNFTIEDLLDFSNDDVIISDGVLLDNVTGNSTDSSTVTCNSAASGGDNNCAGNFGGNSFADSQFSGELCVPYDDLPDLEWLSNFVEDSFSIDQNLQHNHMHLLSGSKALTPESSSSCTQLSEHASNLVFLPETPLPGKARSKRSRAAPCDWSTRLLHVSTKASTMKRENLSSSLDTELGSIRKCLHCGAEKTPQWRTGPMGPKTLCNACGVRYKSGRLVREYRPAASPTFVSTKHSNSHRKVMELRRQKELQTAQQHQLLGQSSFFGLSNGQDEYLIHHQTGSDFRHMI
ncbi:GATA transcription factor 9-like [Mangifera indica]|uniref:GATA transcription factor 9-like n=1 Tax=Mangifera indica TaxID=29780 RepID=UPI001CF971AC|nr:GATA transcription factor 9-like [Mangifera indica]